MEQNSVVYCEACLSVHRNLHPLHTLMWLINETNLVALQPSARTAGGICWECKAIIIRFANFKRKVRLTQKLLSLKQNQLLKSQSSLLQTQTLNITLSANEGNHCDPLANISEVNIKKEMTDNFDIDDGTNQDSLLTEHNENLDDLDKKDNITKIPEEFHDGNVPQSTTVYAEQLKITCEKSNTADDVKKSKIKTNTPETSTESDEKVKVDVTISEVSKTIQTADSDDSKTEHSSETKEYYSVDERGVYRCNICRGLYPDMISIRRHNNRKHRSLYYKFTCDICKHLFNTKSRLEYHMASHSEALSRKLSYCDTCNIQYKNILMYRNHLRTSVNHCMGGYKCQDCPKKFASRTSLNSHRKFYHLGESKHKCDVCDKVFISRYHLQSHGQTQHGMQRSRNHHCPVCQNKFYTAAVLRNHMLTHSSKRTFMCSECGDTFRQKAVLYNHCQLKHKKKVK